MVWLGIHLFVYIAGISLVTMIWVLSGAGTVEEVREIVRGPATAQEKGFWPAYVIVTWTSLLIVHIGVVLSLGLFGRRARKRRRELAKHAGEVAAQLGLRAGGPQARRPSTPTRKWVAVMFTDVVSSTRLTEELGDDEWTRVLSRHREFVRTCFSARGGKEVGTQGDGCLARFSSPADAVSCAVDIQRQLSEVTAEAGNFPLEVRIGVHAGDAVEDTDGDLIGRVVNVAARVTSEAEPGEILVTEPVADHVDGDVKLEDRGLVMLRGVSQPRHLLAVSWG